MKTERRHELQHNELADWIAVQYRRIQPYTTSIFAVVIAVFVLYWAYSWISTRSQTKSLEEWAKTSPSDDPADTIKNWTALKDANSASTPLGMAIRMELGNYCLQLGGGRNLYSRNRTVYREAQANLERALSCFTEVARDAKDQDARNAALFRLAKVQELLGHLDEAKRLYSQFVDRKSPNGDSSVYADSAKAELAQLSNPKTRDFYEALITLQAKPPAVDPTPGLRPDDNLPDMGGLPGSVTDSIKSYDNLPSKLPGVDPVKTEPKGPEKTPEPDKKSPADLPK